MLAMDFERVLRASLLEERRWHKRVLAAPAVRSELKRLRTLARHHLGTSMYLDAYVRFLTEVHRRFPQPPPRPFVPYTRVLL